MNRFTRILVIIAVVLVGFFVVQWIRGFFSDDVASRISDGDQLSIRFAIQDEQGQLLTFARMTMYPAESKAALYFLNTASHYPDEEANIATMSPFSADRFRGWVDTGADYNIYFNEKNFTRLIDFLGGMHIFLPEPLAIKDGRYQYPHGIQFISGGQAMEFAHGQTTLEKGSEHLAQMDRLYRSESILLNLIWQLSEKQELLERDGSLPFLYSLAETDLTAEEFSSLFMYFASDKELDVFALETPLQFEDNPKNPYEKRLLVNEERCKEHYEKFLAQMRTGALDTASFTMDVQNGTERGGMAGRVKQFLHGSGTEVLYAENYERKPLPESVVLERSGSFSIARRIAYKTGRPRNRTFFLRKPLDVMGTFLVGEDFQIKDLKY
ncbi:MAG: LCP family protein [Leptospiraceae bacterium]|nr:LCP family protein [Leptospiraceae bacterium]MCB1304894.1 LCP family protein [Leptospiraceae bacterium]